MATRERIVLVAIVTAVALVLRIGYVAQTYVKDPLRTDAGEYAQYAHNLVEHGVYSKDLGEAPRPDSFRSPGYPLVLAGTRVVAGEEGWHDATIGVQVALGAAMVPLTYALAAAVAPFGIAIAAAALVALSPHLVTATSYVLTETLCGFSLLLALVLLCRALSATHTRTLLASGSLLGWTALVNEAFVLLPVPLVLLVWRHRGRRSAIAFAAACALLPAAWTARNTASVTDPERSGARRAVQTLSHGSYPRFVYKSERWRYGAYNEDPEQPAFGSSLHGFARVMRERVAAEPWRYLRWYVLEKPYYLWSWDILQGQGDVYVFPVANSLYVTNHAAEATRVGMKWLHPVWLLLALIGMPLCWLARRQSCLWRPAVAVVAATILYTTAVYSVFAPWPRYSVPLRPELYAFALWAGWAAWRLSTREVRSKRSARASAASRHDLHAQRRGQQHARSVQ